MHTKPILNLNEPKLENWLTAVLTTKETDFIEIEAFSSPLFENFQQSKGILGMFINDAVDPYIGATSPRWAVLAAPTGGVDLLRCEYVASELRLVLIESVNLVVIKASGIDEQLGHVNDKPTYINHLLTKVVKTKSQDHDWRFVLPTDLNKTWNGQLISSQGAIPIKDLSSRHDRADILIWSDDVYFIFYKRIDQLEDFLPDDQWFSIHARAALRRGVNP